MKKSIVTPGNIVKALILAALILLTVSCEEAPTNDYKREAYIEGYLIVNEPVQGIKVAYTQPVYQPYDKMKAAIKDADVKISGDGKVMDLVYNESDNSYEFSDKTYLVKPNTEYNLEVRLNDGTLLTGRTLTPDTFAWVNAPKDKIYFPTDTLNMNSADTISIEWTPVSGKYLYLLKIDCTDTLNYGKYLTPATGEMNRRCKNAFKDAANMYTNTASWGLGANTKSPCVWVAFRWFGRHEISVYCPDENMMSWFKNNFFTGSSYNVPNLNSIKGGVGVFGSASVVKKEIFLVKNQK